MNRSERENKPAFTPMRKEVNSLELTSSQQETIRYQFECYCKSLLRNEKNYYMRKMKKIIENEISFSELSQREMDSLYTLDEYSGEYFHFDVDGIDVTVKNEILYSALSKLPPQKRDILLLAYYLGKNDTEIAKKLQRAKSTVQYQRTSSLAKLKRYMEG